MGMLPEDVTLPRLVMTHLLYLLRTRRWEKTTWFISLQILPASENLFAGYW